MKRELNEYQAANLRWLLQGCKRNFPHLDTGDWFGELLFLTDGVDVYPNANADAFDAATISDIHEINPANWKRLEDYDRAIAERDEARAECKALHTEAHAAHDVIAQRDRMIDAMTNRAQELALEKMAADRRIAALEAMTCDECGKVIEEENAYAQDGRVFHSACWHDRRSGAACPKCMRELSVDEMRQLHERMPHRRWDHEIDCAAVSSTGARCTKRCDLNGRQCVCDAGHTNQHFSEGCSWSDDHCLPAESVNSSNRDPVSPRLRTLREVENALLQMDSATSSYDAILEVRKLMAIDDASREGK